MTTFDAKSFNKAMDEVPRRLFTFLKRNLRLYLHDFAKGTMTEQAGSALHVRTGQLRQSFHSFVGGDNLDDLRGTVYTDSAYAPTQEFGGPQVMRRKYLTIPLQGNLTPAGDSRGDANLYRSQPTFVRPHPKGWVMYLKTGKRRPKQLGVGQRDPSVVPLFLLVRSTFHQAPGRLRFFDTWNKDSEAREKLLNDSAEAALDGLGKRAS